MSAPWTEAHRREALRRTYEIAGELVTHGPMVSGERCGRGALGLGACAHCNDHSEKAFRGTLQAAGLEPARIDREVRRVRALAEGRLVRETSREYRVRKGPNFYSPGFRFTTEGKTAAKEWRDHHWPGASVVTVRQDRTRWAR